jgi:hypothetical protein
MLPLAEASPSPPLGAASCRWAIQRWPSLRRCFYKNQSAFLKSPLSVLIERSKPESPQKEPRPSVIASALDYACRGSRLSPQSDCLAPRRICHTENAALPHGDGSGKRQGIAMDVQLWLRLLPRLPARNVLQAPGRMLSYHARASSKSSFASGVQTTGSLTVS